MPKATRNNPELTHNQPKTLAFIKQYLADNGYPPTIKEVAKFLGHSTYSGAEYVLASLEAKGQIVRVPGVVRGMRVVKQPARPAKASNGVPDPPPARASRG